LLGHETTPAARLAFFMVCPKGHEQKPMGQVLRRLAEKLTEIMDGITRRMRNQVSHTDA